MSEEIPKARTNRGQKRAKVGIVVSTAMSKTVVVRVTRMMPHDLYVKRIERSRKFLAHDEENQCKVGDKVRIVETRPLSKRKRWRVQKLLERPVMPGTV